MHRGRFAFAAGGNGGLTEQTPSASLKGLRQSRPDGGSVPCHSPAHRPPTLHGDARPRSSAVSISIRRGTLGRPPWDNRSGSGAHNRHDSPATDVGATRSNPSKMLIRIMKLCILPKLQETANQGLSHLGHKRAKRRARIN